MPILSDLPLVQVVQLVIVAAAAVVGIPTAVKVYSERSRLESRAKTTLELLDKLEPGMVGEEQLRRSAQVAVRRLAFLIEYPRTLRRRAPMIALAVAIMCGIVAQTLLAHDVSRTVVWLLIAGELGAAYVANFSMRNTAKADLLINRLFIVLNGPTGLDYPPTKFFRRQLVPGVGDVMDFAQFARDRIADESGDETFLTTVEAANIGRLQAEVKLRSMSREIRRLKWKHRWMRFAVIPEKNAQILYRQAKFGVMSVIWLRQVRRAIAKAIADDPSKTAELDVIYERARRHFGRRPRGGDFPDLEDEALAKIADEMDALAAT
ncbi:hypothetical protein CH262_16960 [Rhodococcus sp. 05-2255-1e]|uniref:hypothetical protein n=1 Tax=Nocardiaceae TaxID=85025 RepID=UPI00050C7FDB|nr:MULTISPECIES: hypothetical protein [Rhodococcus]OZE23704.1 hypothetical protein CH262_16960 [Rhodococcus sp. 05-2255-1e]